MNVYKNFEVGDEVFTKKTYKAITKLKSYIVTSFYKPPGFIEDTEIRFIEVMNDLGFVGRYSSKEFLKTERQKRDDKIKKIYE